ncbi:MAG: carbamoyltransferase N-terminal domain-containing protein, partial [Bradyrhizobium sp.]
MSRSAIIGVSAFVHDTAACLIDAADGRVLHASAEERLTNAKHDSRFPIGALRQAIAWAES